MAQAPAVTSLQIRSLLTRSGELQVSIVETAIPEPASDEVLVRVDAAPINPSDIGLLFSGADMSRLKTGGTAERPMIAAPVSEGAMKVLSGRIERPLPIGYEGAGKVVGAGSSAAAQALFGKNVAMVGQGTYAEYCRVKAEQCLVLPDGASPADGASALVNPLTALCMVDATRREGHAALVHTAAASSLGQMLNRICLTDGIGLVNIVRRTEQEELLRASGAVHVCNSSSETFEADLTEALAATGATIAFDALGGGTLADQILRCMESVLIRDAREYSRYGSPTHKQIYLYGGMDSRPTELSRAYGMQWSVGGWLLFPHLAKIGPAATEALKQRIAAELSTTFAIGHAREISLAEALDPSVIAAYSQRATGGKYLINPGKNAA